MDHGQTSRRYLSVAFVQIVVGDIVWVVVVPKGQDHMD
jgi:hypothetical protein